MPFFNEDGDGLHAALEWEESNKPLLTELEQLRAENEKLRTELIKALDEMWVFHQRAVRLLKPTPTEHREEKG